MPTYCFICDACGDRWTSDTRHATWSECAACGSVAPARRDWKAEGANVNTANLRKARA